VKHIAFLLLFSALASASDRVELAGEWQFHAAAGIYRIGFASPTLEGKSARLILDAAFDGAAVRLNGEDFSPSDALQNDIADRLHRDRPNQLQVHFESLRTSRVPGAHLLIGPRVFISNQRVIATPDAHGAEIVASIWITNVTENTVVVEIDCKASPDGGGSTTGLTVSPGTTRPADLHWTIPEKATRLWDQERPNLYRLTTSLAAVSDGGDLQYHDSGEAIFGIRKIVSRGGTFLLNEKTAETSSPKLKWIGSEEGTAEFLASSDAGGLAIIVHSTGDRSMLRTIIERDRNHPSILAWSIRNEADLEFVKALDPSRPVLVFDVVPKRQ
jgi:hypothetical protein